ncbi:MAG: glycoside hydrolase family 75 protein [Deltaproteobacteria bacterium]|nr:glycoside hydrolase family 75 protein [Deltaproteobacteria bacterium]
MAIRRALPVLCVVLGVLACDAGTEAPQRNDASGVRDMASTEPDARRDLDAALDEPDARADEPDARADLDASVELDAMVPPEAGVDAFVPFDAGWGGCTRDGVMGTCMDVATCTGMAVRGLCPGPAEIQCCLPTVDAGPRPDTGAVTPEDVLAQLGGCARIGGDYATDVGQTADIPVCRTGDVVWWTADLDIDCDGGRGDICMSDPDYLPETSGVDSTGAPLDASTLPFIVIPLASSRFRYADHGIRIGQVGLVLYRDRMVFGIFGDAGPASIIGEASFAMAEALGIPSSPRTGGVDSGVTYLVFTGDAARVARNEDHDEAVRMGEVLLDTFLGP